MAMRMALVLALASLAAVAGETVQEGSCESKAAAESSVEGLIHRPSEGDAMLQMSQNTVRQKTKVRARWLDNQCPAPELIREGGSKATYSSNELPDSEEGASECELLGSFYVQRHCTRFPNKADPTDKFIAVLNEINAMEQSEQVDQLLELTQAQKRAIEAEPYMTDDGIMTGGFAQCSECGIKELEGIGNRFARKGDRAFDVSWEATGTSRTQNTAKAWAMGLTKGSPGTTFQNPRAWVDSPWVQDHGLPTDNDGEGKPNAPQCPKKSLDFDPEYELLRYFGVCNNFRKWVDGPSMDKKNAGHGFDKKREFEKSEEILNVANSILGKLNLADGILDKLEDSIRKKFVVGLSAVCYEAIHVGMQTFLPYHAWGLGDFPLCEHISMEDAKVLGKGDNLRYCYAWGPCAAEVEGGEGNIVAKQACPLVTRMKDFFEDQSLDQQNLDKPVPVHGYFGHVETVVPFLTQLGVLKAELDPEVPFDTPGFKSPPMATNFRADVQRCDDGQKCIVGYFNENKVEWPGCPGECAKLDCVLKMLQEKSCDQEEFVDACGGVKCAH